MKPFLLLAISIFTCATVNAQTSWFAEMKKANAASTEATWKKDRAKTFFDLRGKYYADSKAMMEMSWEERDSIWTSPAMTAEALEERYKEGYATSCRERGIKPQLTTSQDLAALRNRYLQSREAEYVILTPAPTGKPSINSALLYGVRPGHEVIYKLAVSGKAPIAISVSKLPQGLRFDPATRVIRGSLAKTGDYPIKVQAKNGAGSTEKTIIFRVGDNIALTPPMGWNSWNSFASDVTATNMRNTVDVLTKSGLIDFGWSFVNIDDCWMMHPEREDVKGGDGVLAYFDRRAKARAAGKMRFNEAEVTGDTRDANGAIKSNKDFADMKGLTEYIHQHGLKAGLYTSPGPLTCQCYEGAWTHEAQDAAQFANWGFDYLKYDWCGYTGISPQPDVAASIAPYKLMGDALMNVKRDIVYSLCQYGKNDVWKWGPDVKGNLWRTTGDIRDTWESMSKIGFGQAGLENYAAPGHWNDPDMLVVGYVGWSKNLRPTYLSPNEQYTHISLWSLLASPMLIGCDLTRMDAFTKGLLSNPDVIAINQDTLGKQAYRARKEGDIEVWMKPLSKDGSRMAVGVFNRGEEAVDFALVPSMLKDINGKYKMKNAWTRKDLGTLSDAGQSFRMGRHGCVLLILDRG